MGPWPRMRPVGSNVAAIQHHGRRCHTECGGCIAVVIGTTSVPGTGPYDIIAVRNDSTTLATTTVTTTMIFATHRATTTPPPPQHHLQGSKLAGCREQLRNHSGSIFSVGRVGSNNAARCQGVTDYVACPKTKTLGTWLVAGSIIIAFL